jgi:hypothetical protein
MFKTKHLVDEISKVPHTWIFEHFCKLKEPLTGQDLKIKSLFNTTERTPSMCIYYNKASGSYLYKDFSSGKGGDGVNLVKELRSTSYHNACRIIVQSYNDYILNSNSGYSISQFKHYDKYKVKSYDFRSWNTQDQYFWTQFNIGSKLLEQYCVKPLEKYTMIKDENELHIMGNYIYGYFKKDGTLYKIYQPKNLDRKFIKVKSYVQGTEQCTPNNKHLLITSSLKDIMAIASFKLKNIDIVAPDSENTMIDSCHMECWQNEYENVIILYDNDEAGIKAMRKNKEKYPFLKVALLPMSKDPSDSIKDFGARLVKQRLIPILDKKINNG